MSLRHLPPEALDALRRGRALVFLADFRPPALPDRLASTVASLDTLQFYSAILPADFEGEPVPFGLRCLPVPDAPHPTLDSADAVAVNELWRAWELSVRPSLFTLIERIAALDQTQKLKNFLERLPPAEAPPPPKKRKSRKQDTGSHS